MSRTHTIHRNYGIGVNSTAKLHKNLHIYKKKDENLPKIYILQEKWVFGVIR